MRGFLTLEILMALVLACIAISAAVSAGILIPESVFDSARIVSAIETAFSNLQSGTSTYKVEEQESESLYGRTVEAEWPMSFGHAGSSTLAELYESPDHMPDVCDPFTSSDWSHLVRVHSYEISISGLLAGTGYVGAYSLSRALFTPTMLFIAAASTTNPNDPDLFAFQFDSSSAQTLTSSYDTASSSRIGISSLTTGDGYLYVGNAFGSASASTCSDSKSCAQVHIFKIGSSGGVDLASTLSLSTTSLPFAYNATGSTAPVRSLAYYQGMLYVGLQKTVHGDEFNSIDVRDPLHPVWKSGFVVGRTVNTILIRGKYAYIGTDDPTRELMVLDISDPSNLKLAQVWNAPGSTSFGYGSAISVMGSTVRFGRTYSPNAPELSVLASSSAFTEQRTYDPGTSADPESVVDMYTQGRYTFVLLTHRLEVFSTTPPGSLTLSAEYSLPTSVRAASLACRNQYLFVGENRNDGTGVIEQLRGS